jgi:SAM-dependent methyltransferase
VIYSRLMFSVPADAYARFMGRYSEPLAVEFASWAGPRPGQQVLDVGCGPGALTIELVRRLGEEAVSAIDPSESFVAAIRERFPGVDVRSGTAEGLPFRDHSFDAALAQLVVHFMSDPVAGLSEMARVTRPGGVVAACVWDHAGGGSPLDLFWRAVRQLDPEAPDESSLAGAREGQLAELCLAAGMKEIDSSSITVEVPFGTLEDWWEPFTFGVGPAGSYVRTLDERERDLLRARCAEMLPPAPFVISASAWTVKALAY